MSKYYKTNGSVLMAVNVTEWKGLSVTVLRSAKTIDKSYQPFAIETEFTGSLRERFEDATEDEWLAGLAIAEKRQAELDKAAAEKAEGGRYGIKVERHKLYRGATSITGDTIVRCTKTQWIGLAGRYKRAVTYGKPGEMIRDRDRYTIRIDEESLEYLAKIARGRLVVDFVKEAKKNEAAK